MKQEDVYRFWSKVKVGSTRHCWPWTDEVNNKGYGRFSYWTGRHERCRKLAHRFAYELHTGVELGEQALMHTCDNPPCCNPKHLKPGSQLDNIADMHAKRRNVDPPPQRGHENWNARLTEEQVLEILELSSLGWSVAAIASHYPCSAANVRLIVTRKSWRHINYPAKGGAA